MELKLSRRVKDITGRSSKRKIIILVEKEKDKKTNEEKIKNA